ncbi:Dihydrogeodin oxidase [Echria macrotheca]|uniref:Dihydrogeodin oxidase n=1 Tax=Echria macrotheca TaxID=438768 RepID=A0AAJ0B488_9PEZI|nr:Dihydrogeodin oxidase [Echria macrotheca]
MVALSALLLAAAVAETVAAFVPLESRPFPVGKGKGKGKGKGPGSGPGHGDDSDGCVNSPSTRGCWKGDFDIYTDYEREIPPGRVREYELTVTQEVIAVDGYLANRTLFNGQYPGPLIEADWGDVLRITVHNNLTNFNGTTIHWHGIRQQDTNWQDGVPGVTQCPVKPGSSQTYEFRAMQYGSSWYHGHFSLQYSNGLYGPLVIHGPSSGNWDVDLGPWLISDWYHEDAFGLLYFEFHTDRAAIPVSQVLNGHGRFNCSTTDPRCVNPTHPHYNVTFVSGTKYKIAITNTGTLLTQTFWIDGHNFTVIGNDFVAIEPYTTDVITLGIGQRYEIIVEANADLSNTTDFWIHSHFCGLPDLLDSRIGIIRYNGSSTADPPTGPPAHLDFGCDDPAPHLLKPIVPRTVGRYVNGFSPAEYLKIGLEQYPNASDPHATIHRWTLRNVPLQLDWREPSLKKLALDPTPANLSSYFPAETEPYVLDHETGEWVYFVITNNYTVEEANPPRTLPQSVHPIHLHGHDVAILAQGNGPFTSDVVPQLDNPARRDVVNVPPEGWIWIAFEVGNPGAWLIHCHIAWHASSGLGIQFIEQPGKIKGLLEANGKAGELAERCGEWKEWYETVNVGTEAEQHDSGV